MKRSTSRCTSKSCTVQSTVPSDVGHQVIGAGDDGAALQTEGGRPDPEARCRHQSKRTRRACGALVAKHLDPELAHRDVYVLDMQGPGVEVGVVARRWGRA